MTKYDWHYRFFCKIREAEKYLAEQRFYGYHGFIDHYREEMWQVVTYKIKG